MARPVVKGRKRWNRTMGLSLSPEVIKWLKEKKRKTGVSPSYFVNNLLTAMMINELERSF